MSNLSVQVGHGSQWEGLEFRLPPPSFPARIRKAAAEFISLLGLAFWKVVRLWPQEQNFAEPKRILVIRRGGLGDALMATPLLRGLRENFPFARICVLVSQQAVPGLQGCAWVNQVYVVPKSKRDWLPLLRQLRNERIDTAFILHRFYAASLVALAAGIPRRLGFYWGNHGFVLTDGIPFSPVRSQTEQIARLLELVAKPAIEPLMDFSVDSASVQSARELLESWGRDPEKPLVGIHPGGGETAGSSEPAKRWPPERFGQLADLLSLNNGVQVVMLEGPGDEQFVREATQNMKSNLLGIAKSLSLPLFAALLRECHLVVANDTGPMHLAAAQNVPVLAIIGPTHPAYTPPRGAIHKVIWAGAPCAPCYNPEEYLFESRQNGRKIFECWRATHECMTSITPEQVCAAAAQQIGVHAASELRVVSRGSCG